MKSVYLEEDVEFLRAIRFKLRQHATIIKIKFHTDAKQKEPSKWPRILEVLHDHKNP